MQDRTQTWTPQLRENAERLLAEGYAHETVALELGLAESLVRAHYIVSTDLAVVCARWLASGRMLCLPTKWVA